MEQVRIPIAELKSYFEEKLLNKYWKKHMTGCEDEAAGSFMRQTAMTLDFYDRKMR